MAAIQASLPLSHFYQDTLNSSNLSQSVASNELFTPFQLDRITVNPTRFEKYQATLEKQPRLPWGRLRKYGGMQKVQLPLEFVKPRGYPPEVVQKGHRHYGSGNSDARDLAVQQYYDLTHLKKSNVRTSDQLLPPSPSKDINQGRIDLPFPAEHPYYSHTSRFALFPKFSSPDDPVAGDPMRSKIPIHPNTPATAHPVVILNKAKGSPYRRELQENVIESQKKALSWNGENDFYQLMKSVDGGKQPYFPTPPKLVRPNLRLRSEDQRLELRTVNALRNLERDQWISTYDYNYTGNGSSNPMHLDDYHKKVVEKITSNEDNRNAPMRPATTPAYLSPRPLEGRYARLYQQRRPLEAEIRYPDANPMPDSPDVMDDREYLSLPGNPRSLRRKDEWYITETKEKGNSNNGEKTDLQDKRLNEHDRQWRTMQADSTPEHGIESIEKKKIQSPHPQDAEEFDREAKKVEGYFKLPEVSKYYLKEYQDERNEAFEKIEEQNEMKKLELQYEAMQNMHAMRNKISNTETGEKPHTFEQHRSQVLNDVNRFHELRTSNQENKERYDTNLKYSTETICDRGPTTDLHDRQLEGHKNYVIPFMQDIPTVDVPQQNHRGVLSTFVTRSNAFSLSDDTQRSIPEFRSGNSQLLRGSSTGSILKMPGSPPRVGASRSISFNEVVKVATSEYGEKFKVTSSPLSNSNGKLDSSARFRNLSLTEPIPKPLWSLPNFSPALRPSSALVRGESRLTPPQWKWNYDNRLDAEFKPLGWSPKSFVPKPQTSLSEIENSWTKSDSHRKFHEALPETAPDMREHTRHYEFADKSADLRFHHSIKHKEKRHNFYGLNSYHFYN